MQLSFILRYSLPALGLALLLNGCHSGAQEDAAANAANREAIANGESAGGDESGTAYALAKVTTSQPTAQLTLPGELLSYYETDLYPKVDGYVRKMHVDIGDHVREGQVLAEMDAPELTAKLADAFAQVKSSEGVFSTDRLTLRRLLKASQTPGAVSPNDIDLARGKVASDSLMIVGAQARYQAAQEMIGYLKLRAPFSGIITDRRLAPGALVGPSEKSENPLYRLKQENRLRLQLTVPEKYVSDVRQGVPVQFSVNSLPNQLFRGKINRLSYNVQRQIRSMLIEIEVQNPRNLLVPGMFAQVIIPVKHAQSSLVVPSSAIVTNMQGQFVVAVNDGRAKWVNVQKGLETAHETEVYGNLHAGDTILKNGTDEVHDGEQIKTEATPSVPKKS